MINILLKRIISILISLAGVILIGFWLTRLSPGDPVQRIMGASNSGEASHVDLRSSKYDKIYRKLNYYLPVFYITWSNVAIPDSLYYLPQQERRDQILALSNATTNSQEAYKFRFLLEELDKSLPLVPGSENEIQQKQLSWKLRQANELGEIKLLLNDSAWKSGNELTASHYRNLKTEFSELNKTPSLWKLWIPSLNLSIHNQFHLWLFGNKSENIKGVVDGNFGNSTVTGRSVILMLSPPLKVTLSISLLAIALSISIAIPFAVFLTLHRKNKLVKLTPALLLFIYTIPLFFLATLLLMLFANPDFFNWFPASGIAPQTGEENYSLLQRIPYFVLPLISYTTGTTVFFIRLLQSSLEDQLATDHIKTAQAKGASEYVVVAVHALRNSLFPLITSLTTALPAMISGSLLLENIFSIPGMGTEIVRAVQNQDYPVMIAFFLLIGIVTVLIYNLSDLLYAVADPRLRKSGRREDYA